MNTRWHFFAMAGVLTLSEMVGCSRDVVECGDRQSTTMPIDPTLLAFLSRARVAHHMADLKEDADPAGAVAALSAVVDGPVPRHDGIAPAEAREVYADTQARLAELESRLLRFETALRRIDSALLWVPETSYFRGHLFEARGIVEQRRAEDLSKANRTTESAAAKQLAIAAFETAMQIQADVIRQTLAESTDKHSSMTGPSGGSSLHLRPEKSTKQGTHL